MEFKAMEGSQAEQSTWGWAPCLGDSVVFRKTQGRTVAHQRPPPQHKRKTVISFSLEVSGLISIFGAGKAKHFSPCWLGLLCQNAPERLLEVPGPLHNYGIRVPGSGGPDGVYKMPGDGPHSWHRRTSGIFRRKFTNSRSGKLHSPKAAHWISLSK